MTNVATSVTPVATVRLRDLSARSGNPITGPQMARAPWLSMANDTPAQRHVFVGSSVHINDNSIGATAVRPTLAGAAAYATKLAAPPRGRSC
ncbi:MAG TPA: hypothetical protein VFU35_08960 [Jatrophihabitans sp.]|nr:hypothetical protein [Jatrophihabitans sp.]